MRVHILRIQSCVLRWKSSNGNHDESPCEHLLHRVKQQQQPQPRAKCKCAPICQLPFLACTQSTRRTSLIVFTDFTNINGKMDDKISVKNDSFALFFYWNSAAMWNFMDRMRAQCTYYGLSVYRRLLCVCVCLLLADAFAFNVYMRWSRICMRINSKLLWSFYRLTVVHQRCVTRVQILSSSPATTTTTTTMDGDEFLFFMFIFKNGISRHVYIRRMRLLFL